VLFWVVKGKKFARSIGGSDRENEKSVIRPTRRELGDGNSWELGDGDLVSSLIRRAFGNCQVNGLTVRGVAVSISPSFFSCEHRRWIGKAFGRDEALERGKPIFVVARTIVGFAPIDSAFELFGESSGPLLPSEIAQLG
jgi:hypothetical protein